MAKITGILAKLNASGQTGVRYPNWGRPGEPPDTQLESTPQTWARDGKPRPTDEGTGERRLLSSSSHRKHTDADNQSSPLPPPQDRRGDPGPQTTEGETRQADGSGGGRQHGKRHTHSPERYRKARCPGSTRRHIYSILGKTSKQTDAHPDSCWYITYRSDTKVIDPQSRKHKKPQDGATEDSAPRLHTKSSGTRFGNMHSPSRCHIHSLQGRKRGNTTLQHTGPSLPSYVINKPKEQGHSTSQPQKMAAPLL
ncbi:Hypothetical predicted protein [Pelobates cultripes]|uniref:Uncharacterized protein n=1 Tax=Pelobates cultripes TaxID=61616 RepID=A0AAD1W651_PELCU|nr:Hypothetical predicted protein [Pelobates cultripes]